MTSADYFSQWEDYPQWAATNPNYSGSTESADEKPRRYRFTTMASRSTAADSFALNAFPTTELLEEPAGREFDEVVQEGVAIEEAEDEEKEEEAGEEEGGPEEEEAGPEEEEGDLGEGEEDPGEEEPSDVEEYEEDQGDQTPEGSLEGEDEREDTVMDEDVEITGPATVSIDKSYETSALPPAPASYDRDVFAAHDPGGFQIDRTLGATVRQPILGLPRPFSTKEVDANVEVRRIPGKGRCSFARRAFKPGEIIFVELPTLAVVPSMAPELWDIISALHTERPLDLPPIWHLAALCCFNKLTSDQQERVIMQKWVPDRMKPPSDDVERILEVTNLPVDPYLYERYLQVWRYNSFGHHVDTEGLVLYDRVSLLAHDCAASGCWHYGDQDAFVLRARRFLQPGDEITISYVGDDDLYKSTNIRQEKLAGWLFRCSCGRCTSAIDETRGFRCPECGIGTVFFKTIGDVKLPSECVTTSSSCPTCYFRPTERVINEYLSFEDAYAARLDETTKDDPEDAEAVYAEAQRIFSQHWIMFTLDAILFEAYRDGEQWQFAATHQTKRTNYALQAYPLPSHTLAWIFEERGDMICNAAKSGMTGAERNLARHSYELAFHMLLLLCGYQHEYTLTAYNKMASIKES